MNHFIRAATPEDARSIATITVLGWRAAYRGLMPDSVLDALSVDDRTRSWTRVIAAPESAEQRVWLLSGAKGPIGFASVGPSRDPDAEHETSELYAIYLEPDHIGHGHGARLFGHVIQDLAKRGSRALTLWALDGNVRADRFYRSMGMSPNGEKIETVRGAALPHIRYWRAISDGGRPRED